MGFRETAYGVFHPGWLVAGVALGLGLQLAAGLTGFGLLGGLSGYLAMGLLIGVASPGDTVIEPGVAAFVIATLAFVFDHFLLSLFGVGLVLAVVYGTIGLLVGVAGGWLGERLQGAV